MYNRYVPQPDGSFRKNRVPEPRRSDPQTHRPTPPVHVQKPSASEPPPHLPPPPEPRKRQLECPRQAECQKDSITGFFKQLLPKDLDTADLLIILLLLLMAGDKQEDKNNALLTLALYFFM